MRKLLLTLAVLCGTVSGWTQGQTVTSITSGKWYQLKCTATDYAHGYGANVWLSDNGTAFAGKSATPTSFQFIATGNGTYHILSYKSNKYLGASGTSVVQEQTPTTEWTVGTINNDGYVYISSSDKNYLNNADGTNKIQIKNHGSGVSSGNSCSLWYLTEEPESKYPFTVSSESEKYYYAIKSGRDNDGKTWWYTYTPSDGKIQLTQFVASDDQLWYFMEVTEGENTYIRLFPKNGNGMAMSYDNTNGGANKIVAKPIGTDGWTNTWEFVKSGGFAPYGLKTPTATMYLSNHSGVGNKMGMHSAAPLNDAGTAMYIMTSAEARNEVVKPEVLTNAKNTAKAELDGLYSVPTIYPTDPEAYKTRIDAVSILAEGTDAEIIDSYLKSVPAVQSIVTEYRNVAYQGLEGKYYTFNTPGRSDKGYIRINNDVVIGVKNADSPIDLWKFICKDNAVLVYNQFLKKYLCEPAGNSSRVAVTSEQSQAGRYHLNVNTSADTIVAKIKLTSNGKSVHMDGSGYLVRWDNGGASEWTVTLCDESFLAQTVANYKNSAVSSLDVWAKLPKVFDTERIAEVKTAIADLTDADAIDNQVRSLFVSGENEDNIRLLAWNHGDGGRVGEYLSVDKSTNKAYGTKDMSFDAIWSLRYLGNCKFAFYNLFNQKYLGTPSANAPMQQTPVAMYFELQNANDAKVVIKTNANEVMHLSIWQPNASKGTPLHAIENQGAGWNASWWDLEFEDKFEIFEAEVDELINEYNNKYFNVPVGFATFAEDTKTQYEGAVESFRGIAESSETDLYMLTNMACWFKTVVEGLPTIVQAPKGGKFYRLQNVKSGKYMSGNGTTIKLTDDENASDLMSTVFYLAENNVWLSFADGRYLDTNNRGYSAVGVTNPGEFGFANGGSTENVITYKNNNSWTYGGADTTGDGTENSLDRGSSANDNGYNWTIEEVTWLPVPMNTTAGYATLYSPVALSTYEDGSTTEHRVEAYVGTINNNYFSMERIDAEDGIIPANTPVVLKYVNGYDETKKAVYLEIKDSEETCDIENALEGTVADTYISTPSYVLSAQGTPAVVGFYKAMMNQQEGASFLNNGFRAYLPAGENNARSLVFDFGGNETGIDELKGENGNVKAEVYDLAGRRVLNAKKGVFVVNGKVIVK